MANFYLDTSAVGNEYQAYAATPTWGALSTDKPLPMDGNGKAGPGHSAAVAIAEIQITVLPADGNTLTIAGAVVTAKTAAAAKNQWTLGASIATCVTNLVALLNTFGTGTAQCDATVSTSASAAALALPYWQFARVKPGTTDTLQIATRIAGGDMNQASNSAVAISSSGWGTPPTLTQFAGGADGPFAYFVANAAVFGKAVFGYGIMVLKSSAGTDPAASGAEAIITRTRRSGADLTTALSTSGTAIALVTPTSTSRTFLFDDGTTWSGDNGQFQLSLTGTSGTSTLYLSPPAAGVCLKLCARAKYGLRIRFVQAVYGGSFISGFLAGYGTVLVENADVGTTDVNTLWGLTRASNAYQAAIFIGCMLRFKRNQSLVANNIDGNTYNYVLRVIGCTVEYSAGTDVSQLFFCTSGAFPSSGPNFISLKSTTFTVDGGAHNVAAVMGGGSNIIAGSRLVIEIDNCAGLDNMSIGFTQGPAVYSPQFYWGDAAEGRSFRYETTPVTVDWDTGGVYPTLNGGAVTPENAAYGLRVQWGASRLDTRNAMPFAKIATMHTDTAATRTVKVELLAPTAEVPTKAQLFAVLKYTGNDGATYYDSSREPIALHDAGLATALDAGTGTGNWTLNGLTGLGSYKISFTTAIAVKPDTRVEVELFLGGPPSSDRLLYINPELLIA